MDYDTPIQPSTVREKLYLLIGQANVLQNATEVEFLDRKFPTTNDSLLYYPNIVLFVRKTG